MALATVIGPQLLSGAFYDPVALTPRLLQSQSTALHRGVDAVDASHIPIIITHRLGFGQKSLEIRVLHFPPLPATRTN